MAYVRKNIQVKLNKVVEEYNEVYFKPTKKLLDELYTRSLLDNSRYFDERLEVDFYELWHHEGRRARMGTAMMAPDYAWWHGFYEFNTSGGGSSVGITGRSGMTGSLNIMSTASRAARAV